MVRNDWIRRFIREELTTIVVALDRRNINEVADRLVDTLEQKRLTVVPTYLSDEMYNVQKNLSSTLTYPDASKLYTTAVVDFSNRKSSLEVEDEPKGSFW